MLCSAEDADLLDDVAKPAGAAAHVLTCLRQKQQRVTHAECKAHLYRHVEAAFKDNRLDVALFQVGCWGAGCCSCCCMLLISSRACARWWLGCSCAWRL